MLTGRDPIQQRMFELCGLGAYIPALGSIHPGRHKPAVCQRKHHR
jgi:hypothetical protein